MDCVIYPLQWLISVRFILIYAVMGLASVGVVPTSVSVQQAMTSAVNTGTVFVSTHLMLMFDKGLM